MMRASLLIEILVMRSFLPLFRLKLNAIEQRYFRSGRLTLFLGRLVQVAPFFRQCCYNKNNPNLWKMEVQKKGER